MCPPLKIPGYAGFLKYLFCASLSPSFLNDSYLSALSVPSTHIRRNMVIVKCREDTLCVVFYDAFITIHVSVLSISCARIQNRILPCRYMKI